MTEAAPEIPVRKDATEYQTRSDCLYCSIIEFTTERSITNAVPLLATIATISLNNELLLLRNYQLVVAQQKFDALKTNICPKSKRASRWTNMLVLRTSRFHAIIRPIVPRYKYSNVFAVHYKIFLRVPVQKSY